MWCRPSWVNQKWSSLLKNVIKKGKISGKKEKISQGVAYAVLISLEYVENWSGNTRFWFINKNKLQRWKKAMYIYVKHPTNICYWSIILINAQTLATVVIYFVHAKYQTVQMHMLQCKVLLIIISYIWSKDVSVFLNNKQLFMKSQK